MALINAPCGDRAAGERGIAALPGREEEFRDSFLEALAYARELRRYRDVGLCQEFTRGRNYG